MREHIHTDEVFNPDCVACLAAELDRLRDEDAYDERVYRNALNACEARENALVAEVERLREVPAWRAVERLEAEVERLRKLNFDRLTRLEEARAEVERLRAENVDLEYAAKVIDDEHRAAVADRDRVRAVLRQLVEADEAECEYDGREIAEDSILAQARAVVMEE